jgi:hypothetical protein
MNEDRTVNKLPFALIAAASVLFMSAGDLQAQYYNQGPGYGNNACQGNYTDPRLGYCLKNDCYGCGGGYAGGGYGGGCGGGYAGGGCGGGCGGAPAVIVRVKINGGSVTPSVNTFYPQAPAYGCPGGCYSGQTNSAAKSQYASTSGQRPAAVRTQSGSGKNVGFRYKF